jgi:hypothetical protein
MLKHNFGDLWLLLSLLQINQKYFHQITKHSCYANLNSR